MKIVVCVKQVPDSAAKVVVEDGEVTWGDAPLVINPWDEFAVEAALVQKEAHDGEVTVVTVGDEASKEALKHALAMGCGEALLISDPTLAGADSQAVARVLAATIQKMGDVDLVFFGRQAIDGDMGVTSVQTARALGWPVLSLVSVISSLDPAGGTICVERSTEEGRQIVESKLPAAVSVVKDIGEPRYPSFMGIRKASRANIPTWSLADLGMEAPASAVKWPELMNAPVREVQTELISGDSPQEVAEKLADKILAEKVL
ncbi:MAG: electron transfer flavoprotein subunit beta/FixA family protein [Anaerolineales bacterium]